MKKILAVCLIFLLLIPSAGLASVFPFTALRDFEPEMEAFSAVLSADAKVHMPFSDERLSWLNALLSHVDLMVAASGDVSAFAIRVDGKEALRADFLRGENEVCSSFSCLPGKVFRSAALPLSGESLSRTYSLYGLNGGEHAAQEQWFDFLCALPSRFPEKTKTAAVNSKLKGYGTVREKQTLTLKAEEAGAFAEETESLISGFRFQGKQVLTVLSDEAGNPLKLTFSGACGREGDLRKVSLTWLHTGEKNKITLKTPTADAKARNNLVLEESVAEEGGTERWQCSFRYEALKNKVKTVTKGDLDLSCRETGEGPLLSGTAELTRTEGSQTASGTVLAPELILSPGHWFGTLGVTVLEGKKEMEKATLTVDVSEGAALPGPNPLEAEEMDETAIAKLSDAAIAALIRPLVLLPEEDTLFLSYELPEGVWEAVVEAAADPKEVSE